MAGPSCYYGCPLSWYPRGGWSGVADDCPQRKARATEPIHRLGCVGLELGAQGGHMAGPSCYYGCPLSWYPRGGWSGVRTHEDLGTG